MNSYNIFYSWQSENKNNGSLLDKVISDTIEKLNKDGYKINFERSITASYSGSPNIMKVTLDNIKACDVFVADLTSVGIINNRTQQNCNVCYELGFANAHLNNENIILLHDDSHKPEELFFDIRQNRANKYKIINKKVYSPDGTDFSKDLYNFIKKAMVFASKNKIIKKYDNKCFTCLNKYDNSFLEICPKNAVKLGENTNFTIMCLHCISHLDKIFSIHNLPFCNDIRINDGSKDDIIKIYDKFNNMYDMTINNNFMKLFRETYKNINKTSDITEDNNIVNDISENNNEVNDVSENNNEVNGVTKNNKEITDVTEINNEIRCDNENKKYYSNEQYKTSINEICRANEDNFDNYNLDEMDSIKESVSNYEQYGGECSQKYKSLIKNKLIYNSWNSLCYTYDHYIIMYLIKLSLKSKKPEFLEIEDYYWIINELYRMCDTNKIIVKNNIIIKYIICGLFKQCVNYMCRDFANIFKNNVVHQKEDKLIIFSKVYNKIMRSLGFSPFNYDYYNNFGRYIKHFNLFSIFQNKNYLQNIELDNLIKNNDVINYFFNICILSLFVLDDFDKQDIINSIFHINTKLNINKDIFNNYILQVLEYWYIIDNCENYNEGELIKIIHTKEDFFYKKYNNLALNILPFGVYLIKNKIYYNDKVNNNNNTQVNNDTFKNIQPNDSLNLEINKTMEELDLPFTTSKNKINIID